MTPTFKRSADGEAISAFARTLDEHGIAASRAGDGTGRLEFPLPFKRDGEDEWMIAEGGVILVHNERLLMQRLIMLAKVPDEVLSIVDEADMLPVLNALNHYVVRFGTVSHDAGDGCVTWRSMSLVPQSGIISQVLAREMFGAMVEDIGCIMNAIDEYRAAPRNRRMDVIRSFTP